MVRNAFSPAAFLDKRKGPCMKSDWLKHWKQNGLVALAIVLFSELGLHFVISDFRISLAVVLFPFFLLALLVLMVVMHEQLVRKTRRT